MAKESLKVSIETKKLLYLPSTKFSHDDERYTSGLRMSIFRLSTTGPKQTPCHSAAVFLNRASSYITPHLASHAEPSVTNFPYLVYPSPDFPISLFLATPSTMPESYSPIMLNRILHGPRAASRAVSCQDAPHGYNTCVETSAKFVFG